MTRPAPGDAATAAALAAIGWRAVRAPMLHVAGVPPRLPPLGPVQAVLVSSGQALPFLPEECRRIRLLAVGDATAARARTLGFARVDSADGDAMALAAAATRLLRPEAGPLLLAVGLGHGRPLAASLRAAGFRVRRAVVYRADPVRCLPPEALAAIERAELAAALFFSAETARAFVRAVPAALRPRLGGIAAIAIAPPVAGALRPLPWREVRVAVRPTQGAMLALL